MIPGTMVPTLILAAVALGTLFDQRRLYRRIHEMSVAGKNPPPAKKKPSTTKKKAPVKKATTARKSASRKKTTESEEGKKPWDTPMAPPRNGSRKVNPDPVLPNPVLREIQEV